MKTTKVLGVLAAPLLMFALSGPGRADTAAVATPCKDGTTSTATGRGACSGHGGMQKAAKSKSAGASAAPAAASSAATVTSPAATSPTAGTQASPAGSATHASTAPARSAPTESKAPSVVAANTDPAGATAKCKDGTYSKSQHRTGSCSHHGGVAAWLTAAQ